MKRIYLTTLLHFAFGMDPEMHQFDFKADAEMMQTRDANPNRILPVEARNPICLMLCAWNIQQRK